jgi:hypothetical protein
LQKQLPAFDDKICSAMHAHPREYSHRTRSCLLDT